MKSALHTTAVKKPAVKYCGIFPEVEEKIFSFTSKFSQPLVKEAFIIVERRYAFVLSGSYRN